MLMALLRLMAMLLNIYTQEKCKREAYVYGLCELVYV